MKGFVLPSLGTPQKGAGLRFYLTTSRVTVFLMFAFHGEAAFQLRFVLSTDVLTLKKLICTCICGIIASISFVPVFRC